MQHKSYVTDDKQLQQLYDESLFRQISNVEHIKATTDELNNLKDTIRDKKKLKEKRNIQTAKLSRDRKKLEVEFMREIGIAYLTCLNKVRNQFHKLAASSHGQKRAFAREALTFIQASASSLPQNFEFVSDSTQDTDSDSASLADHNSVMQNESLSSVSQSDNECSNTYSMFKRKKGRPRKNQQLS